MPRKNYSLDIWGNNGANWDLPVIKVSDGLNPFSSHGVEMFVALGYHLPFETLKFLAVFGMLRDAKKSGIFQAGDSLVEATSGATGLVLAKLALAEPFNASRVIAIMKEDAPLGKSKPPFFAGAEVWPPQKGLSPIATARKLGGGGWKSDGWKKSDDGFLNLDQYANPANKVLYRDWCVSKILEKVPNPNILVAPIGTGGTIIGLNEGFRRRLENFRSVGVMCVSGNEIPGMRDIEGMKEIAQPWREAVDECVEVKTKSAYLSALWLNWVMGVTSGASGGATLAGAYHLLNRHDREDTLDLLRNPKDGKIRIVIIIHDGWRPYLIDRFPTFLSLEDQQYESAHFPWETL